MPMEKKKPKYLALQNATFTDEDGKVKLINYDNLKDYQIAFFKQLTLSSLFMFTQFWYFITKRIEFMTNWHHELICNELELVQNYEYDFLNVNIPPGHSKTELAAINFLAHCLAKNPSANNIYLTASEKLRKDVSIRIRDIIDHPLYKKMYGVELSKTQSSNNLWKTNHGGGLVTSTIFGAITGFGAGKITKSYNKDGSRIFDGCIVLDDIDKIADATNKNQNNENTQLIVLNTVLSRGRGDGVPIISIQQRAGENDSTATLTKHFENSKYSKIKNIILPVLTYENILNENNEITGTKEIFLWESVFGKKECDKIMTNPETNYTFETQYQQSPTSKEAKLFRKESFNYFDFNEFDVKKTFARISITDPNAKKDGDFFASIIVGFIDKKAYILDVIFNKNNTNYNVPKLGKLINEHSCNVSIVEINQGGDMLYNSVVSEVNNELYRIIGTHETANKQYKIDINSSFITKYVYFRNDNKVSSEYLEFINNLANYTKKAKHDDAADVCANLINYMYQNSIM